jgi:hypothetical protein
MKKMELFLMGSALLILAGCKTTEPEETVPVSWREQQAYLARASDPRIFGLSIYETPAGPQIRGGGRLHPGQAEALPMLLEAPFRPVVNLHGNFGVQWPVLLDLTASVSCLEFDTARKVGARPVGEQAKPQLVKLPGEDVASCVSLVPSLRLGQLFVENPLVYVRMANGSLGRAARGIDRPGLRGVVGWNVLEKLEQIQFLYSIGQVVLKTTDPYVPNPGLLVAELPLVEHAGACAVRGVVNGKRGLILLDPAGDFEVAAGGTVSSLKLGTNLTLTNPAVSSSPGGVRVGSRLLQNYRVTICPKAGVVYFETKMTGEE